MPPLVSVCCVTYNHADTIAQALESFLAQQGGVTLEILVHDDCSTDGTQAVLERYASRYPEIVKPLYETENQYRKGIAMDATFNFPRATGEYIALCEGDDFWCDPLKLRRQIDFLQAHPACTFCFTNGYVRDVAGGEDRPFIPYHPQDAAEYTACDRTCDLAQIARLTFIPTASFVFPRAALARVPRALLLAPCPMGDLRLKLLLTAAGEAAYVHAFTCVYRLNAPGSTMADWGTEAAAKTRLRCQQVIAMLEGVDAFSGGRWHEALRPLMEEQYRVLLEAAPTLALLRDPKARLALRALAPSRRLKCWLKAVLPRRLFTGLKRALRRG